MMTAAPIGFATSELVAAELAEEAVSPPCVTTGCDQPAAWLGVPNICRHNLPTCERCHDNIARSIAETAVIAQVLGSKSVFSHPGCEVPNTDCDWSRI